jgi:hypothetical protein
MAIDLKDALIIVARQGCDDTHFAHFMNALEMRDRFLRGKASFQDFLDTCQTAGVPMDRLAEDWTYNLLARGVRI